MTVKLPTEVGEFDCHLYYRRSNFLALELGGLMHWEDRLAANLQPAAAGA